MKSLILAALAATLFVVACDDTTPTPDVPDATVTKTDASPVVKPDATQTPDVAVDTTPVVDTTDYCAELKAVMPCGTTMRQVDEFLNFVPKGIEVSYTCKSNAELGFCQVHLWASKSHLDNVYVFGTGVPTEDSYYDTGVNAFGNDDESFMDMWFQTTIHGDPCLAIRNIGGGGGVLSYEFL